MKSEPDEFSIDDLASRAKDQSTPWFGVRNYQARNFMRDDMQVGDRAFFYHSSCPEPGIAGIVEVSRGGVSRRDAIRPKSPYYDAKATREAPRWMHVDVKLVEKTRLVPLAELQSTRGLERHDHAAQRGNRLSITPVTRRGVEDRREAGDARLTRPAVSPLLPPPLRDTRTVAGVPPAATLTAQYLNSGILPNGSSTGLVSRFAAAS